MKNWFLWVKFKAAR